MYLRHALPVESDMWSTLLGHPHKLCSHRMQHVDPPIFISVGTYRVLILSALAQHPAAAVDNLTASMPDKSAWKAEPDNVDAMHEFYTGHADTHRRVLRVKHLCGSDFHKHPVYQKFLKSPWREADTTLMDTGGREEPAEEEVGDEARQPGEH